MEILAIIPARGGSKGIPRKNIIPLCRKPLITWTIEAALNSKLVSRTVVSTDSTEIAEVSRQNGAEIVWRPSDISGDKASSESALLHVLDTLKQKENYKPDIIVFLQCTSPLTIAQDIDGIINKLLEEKADSALTACDFHYFLWREVEGNSAQGINHDKSFRPLRQDKEPQFKETGSVYVMKTDGFLKYKHRFFGKTVMYKIPIERCYEIDDLVDLKITEVLLCEQIKKSRKFTKIDAVFMDFDGVFTDNKVFVSQNGEETVCCDRSDGLGINKLRTSGIKLFIISTESNIVVNERAKKLNIECYYNIDDKLNCLKSIIKEYDFKKENVVFVGNDINDIECIKYVGLGVAVNDAYREVKLCADIILQKKGGNGALRELADLILNNMKENDE